MQAYSFSQPQGAGHHAVEALGLGLGNKVQPYSVFSSWVPSTVEPHSEGYEPYYRAFESYSEIEEPHSPEPLARVAEPYPGIVEPYSRVVESYPALVEPFLSKVEPYSGVGNLQAVPAVPELHHTISNALEVVQEVEVMDFLMSKFIFISI